MVIVNFAIFNIADSAVTVGCVLLGHRYLLFEGEAVPGSETPKETGGSKVKDPIWETEELVETETASLSRRSGRGAVGCILRAGKRRDAVP